MQYAALSTQLRQEADKSAYVRQSFWVTGSSSPQVGPITIASRNQLSDTKIEYTLSFPQVSSGQTYAIATEKMVVEKLSVNGREGWFITQILQASGYGIIEGPVNRDGKTMAAVRILADGLQVPIPWDNAAKVVNQESAVLIAGSSVDFPLLNSKMAMSM